MLGLIGSIVGGFAQASAAKKAARAQERAADKQVEFATETRDLTRSDLAPYYQGGLTAQNALMSMLGLAPAPVTGGTAPGITTEQYEISPGTAGSAPTERQPGMSWRDWHEARNQPGAAWNPFAQNHAAPAQMGTRYRVGDQTFATMEEAQEWANANQQGGEAFQAPVKAPYDLTLDDFQADPGYEFRLGQGLEAVQGSAAARHGLASGATMNALQKYGQGFASNEYGNFYNRKSNEYNNYTNRLTNMAGSGQNAAAGMGSANALASQQVNQAYGNMGNAQAAGAIGVGNAINDGIGNAVGAWQFNKLLQPGGGMQSPGMNWTKGLW